MKVTRMGQTYKETTDPAGVVSYRDAFDNARDAISTWSDALDQLGLPVC